MENELENGTYRHVVEWVGVKFRDKQRERERERERGRERE